MLPVVRKFVEWKSANQDTRRFFFSEICNSGHKARFFFIIIMWFRYPKFACLGCVGGFFRYITYNPVQRKSSKNGNCCWKHCQYQIFCSVGGGGGKLTLNEVATQMISNLTFSARGCVCLCPDFAPLHITEPFGAGSSCCVAEHITD